MTMKRKLSLFIFVVFMALIATGLGGALSAWAGSQAKAPQQPGSAAGPLAPVGSGFTYQGQLIQSGVPADGQYDFIFTLYDAATDGSQVGTPVTLDNQTVSQGLFTVPLDFGASAFQGDERWLEIAVRPTGGEAYSTLSPRQPLTPAPYAMSLMPGATISGALGSAMFTVNNSAGAALSGEGTDGVRGIGSTNTGYGVFGSVSSGTQNAGVYGLSTATNGAGVLGQADFGSLAYGVWGKSAGGHAVHGESTTGYGVYGTTSGSSTVAGVYGYSSGSGGVGVTGEANTGSSSTGVWGKSTAGYGTYGDSTNRYGAVGVSINSIGVYGTTLSSASSAAGVYGFTSALHGDAIIGESNNGIVARGVWGKSTQGTGVVGQGDTGVLGLATDTPNGTGVFGSGNSEGVHGGGSVYGVYGTGGSYGVYGSGGTWAGYFSGNVRITGTCCAMAEGYSQIDHPLDPTNKYLQHSFVQSPDMMDVYNGNVTLDAAGEATVQMPAYFEALNKDFRYQLTAIGAPGPNLYITEKMANNRFKIAGGKPGTEVSWQVTGVRHDPYAEAHRIAVEPGKLKDEQGKYLHPKEYGQPDSKGINYDREQQVNQRFEKATDAQESKAHRTPELPQGPSK
jgi:hypothetical protein